jgi:excisionase family DNA binding protein
MDDRQRTRGRVCIQERLDMGTRKISEVERQRRALQRALSIDEFCQRYGIGRTTVYAEIKEGRLRARKCGRRTIISDDDSDEWFRHLPAIGSTR